MYRNIPDLLSPVINTPEKALNALQWTGYEIKRRYKFFAEASARTLAGFIAAGGGEELPRILLVYRAFSADDLQDYPLLQITGFGQTAGIHLVFVTDQLSTESISRQVKANIADRLVFKVTSLSDSNLAEVKGAEKLSRGKQFTQKPVKKWLRSLPRRPWFWRSSRLYLSETINE